MPPSFSLTRMLWACALAGALMLGCVPTRTPATRFYLLTPLAPGQGLVADGEAREPLSIEIASLHLPQYLERPQIVLQSSRNRLELAEFDQWGGNLRKNMMRVLAKNLSQLLATPRVSISPYSPQGSPDYRVELTVMNFERDPGGRVRLCVQWRLSGGGDRGPLGTQVTDLASPVVPTGPDLEPTVSAMSALLGELSRLIAQTLWNDVQGRPAP
ncbi:MAG: membrane integrity-associated transporter subunit PqiC [Deltaproteobacteria bacterium]|nr:membrane integrity-associated transporter subunit PqiC [Deltaproteobacteria bacterium]